MIRYEFKRRRYEIEARRDHEGAPWTDWAQTDTLEAAMAMAEYCESFGYLVRVVDTDSGKTVYEEGE